MLRNIFLFCSLMLIIHFANAQASGELFPKLLQEEIKRAVGENVGISEFALPIDKSLQFQTGKFYRLSATSVSQSIRYVYVGKVNTCRAGGCSIIREQTNETSSEYFEYFILFDSVATVMLVRIFNYKASHGQEITSKGWLKQFVNFNGNKELIAGKNIDAISGATISVDAITFDIQDKTAVLKQTIHAR